MNAQIRTVPAEQLDQRDPDWRDPADYRQSAHGLAADAVEADAQAYADACASEELYGPVGPTAEVERYRQEIYRPRSMHKYPGAVGTTEAEAIRHDLNITAGQLAYSIVQAPEQVTHWRWVLEAVRRDLVIQTPASAIAPVGSPDAAAPVAAPGEPGQAVA